jgi:hypothetical protein
VLLRNGLILKQYRIKVGGEARGEAGDIKRIKLSNRKKLSHKGP